MGVIYEKIILYGCMLTFSLLISINVNSQVIEKFNMNNFPEDNINQLLIKFWENTHDINHEYKIINISDLSLKNTKGEDYSTSNVYFFHIPIDSSFYRFCRDSNNVVRILAHTSDEIEQVILINDGYLYLIDMRNSLQLIIDNIYSITDFSDEYINDIVKEVTHTHKKNWYLRHLNDRYIEDDYFNNEWIGIDERKYYNPNEW
jgi:hypothetical protein